MKDLEYYLSNPYPIEIIPSYDGGYAISYPDLPGCLTCGETLESALENAKDAKRAWLEAAIEDGVEIDEPGSIDDYSGQFRLRMPKSLHKALAQKAKREGVSINQYCIYLLSMNITNDKYVRKRGRPAKT